MMIEHDRIYLTPKCNSVERCCEPDRSWCENPENLCSECDLPPVEYLLATPQRRVASELYDSLVEALDFMEGMLMGAAILRGEIGTIKIEPSAEMVRLRSVLAKARGETP